MTTADHTALLQDWIDKACRLDGFYGPACGTLHVPPGEYRTTDTLAVGSVAGLRLSGDGLATRIVYDGPPGRPVVELRSSAHCDLSGLTLFTKTPGTAAAVRVTNNGPGDPSPGWAGSCNDFSRLFAGAYPGTPGSYAVAYDLNITARGGPDQNNDFPAFRRCTAANYSYAGWRVLGANLHGTRLDNCQALGQGAGKYGICCDYGSFASVEGGYFNGHTESDVAALDFQMVVVIRYLRSEGSARLFLAGGPTGAPLPVDITGCVWDGDPREGEFVVDNLNPGPFVFHANTVRSRNGVNPRMRLWGLGPVSASVRSHFAGGTFTAPAVGNSPGAVEASGCLHQQPDGSVVLAPVPPRPAATVHESKGE